ncbi:MAG TPA: LPXTG cell wall anchor domain-containing protein [Microbacterium sp.]|nr:LPXTG cell wall anchor domain-containing protein [Microbacterium sp.]
MRNSTPAWIGLVRPQRWSVMIVSALLAASSLVVAGAVPTAAAASVTAGSPAKTVGPVALEAGHPGVPSDPTVAFLENFENGTAGASEGLGDYPGTAGVTYTAEYPWLEQTDCNGTILSYSVAVSPCPNGSNQAFPRDNTRRLADVLGQVAAGVPGGTDAAPANGSNATTQANRALTAFTNTINPAANSIALESIDGASMVDLSTSRYLTFSVDVAELSCTFQNGTNVSRLNFFLTYDGAEHPTQDAPISACSDPSTASYTSPTLPDSGGWGTGGLFVRAGTFLANGSQLVPAGTELGVTMRNATGTGVGNDFAFDNIRLLDVTPQLDKSFSPASVPVGGTSTLTLTVTNTSELGAKDGWGFTDTLPDGLVVADPTNTGGTCAATTAADAGGSTITVTNGSLAAGEASCTITVDVTSDTPTGADPSPKTYTNCAENITDQVGILDPACAEVEFYSTPALEIEKTSDADADTRVGDTVTYSVSATNTGDGDYTVENPAVVLDDLSGVLDDGTFNNDAVASQGDAPAYAEPLLSWSGPLAVGDTVTLTYSVTLTADGDRQVRNVAWAPEDPNTPVAPACDPPADGVDPVTGEPCAPAEFELPALAVSKSSDTVALPTEGGTVTYTVTVENVSGVDYTATAPATVTDDLTDVLDDATYNDDATVAPVAGTLSYTEPELSWSGPLAAGATATITYSVTYTGEGDAHLVNTACVPDDDAADPAAACAETSVPAANLTAWKEVTADPSPAQAGSVLTYTLHFANDGTAPADVDMVDDLSHVLDDADVTTEPQASTTDLTAVRDGAQISITGQVPAGAEVTVTYQVTVKPDDARGDNTAANFLLEPDEVTPPDPECVPTDPALPDCTVTPIPELVDSKSVDPASGTAVSAGETLAYTLTFTNSGTAPASVDRVDDLSGVLDDAELVADSIVVTPEGDLTATLNGDQIAITGSVPAGATITVSYQVTVLPDGERGDNSLGNFLLDPDEEPPAECATDDPDCTVNPVPELVDSKSVDPASGTAVSPGQTLTYTLTFTNSGTAPASVDRVDDLSGVLDDASFVDGSLVVAPEGDLTATLDGTQIAIAGSVPAGATITVSYQVTVLPDGERGDNSLGNFLLDPDEEPPAECATDDPDCTVNPVPELVDSKSVDPASGTAVSAGETLTYTLTFANNGTAPASVDRVDDLSGVLDDASFVDGSLVVAPEGDLTATLNGDQIAITGSVPAGATITVSYQVTVLPDGERGDNSLGNFLLDPDEEPPAECATDDPDCTVNPVPELVDSKSVDPASGTAVSAGDTLTYTLTFTNNGTAPASVDRVDDLSGVLDDAELVADSIVVNPEDALTAELVGEQIAITGSVPAGATITVSYQVTVLPDGERGDNSLGNFLLDPDEEPPAECATDDPDCTVNPVPELVDSKSVDPASGTAVSPGQTLTYTLTFTNNGTAPASVDRVDDLSGVLDDASFVDGSLVVSPEDALTAELVGGQIAITGSVPAGATITVSYQVTVLPDGERGDNSLGNFLLDPDQDPPAECATDDPDCTVNPVPELVDSKSVDPASGTAVNAGDTLTYTLTFTNNGTAPASVDRVDDLSGVLDDAELVADSIVVNPEGDLTAELTGEQIAITGSVPAGATVTVSYQVTVLPDGERGDNSVANFLLDPDQDPPAECATDDPDCTVNPVPELVDSKSVDPASGTAVSAGETLTYTLTFTNSGTAPASVDRVDDLSGVLDDASFVDGSLVVAPEGDLTAELDGDQIAITGSVPAGATITVSYQVTVLPDGERGDNSLGNFLLNPDEEPPAECATDDPDCTVNPVPELVDSKSVDPASGTAVSAGQTVTYTLTFTNSGTAPATVNRVDDLSGVLDDASFVDGSLVVDPEGTLTATLDDSTLVIGGTVPADTTATVTYQVSVLPDGQRGDNSLANFLLDPDEEPPAECATDDPDCTVNPVPELVDSKSVDPASGTAVSAGDTLTYTLTFTNNGTAPASVDRVDDLSGVLDDAELVADSIVVNPEGDLTAELNGEQIAITGSVPAGATVTVSYQVTVLPDGERGDNSVANFLLDPDEEPPAECATDDPDCTVNPVPELVDSKSVDPASGTAVSAGQALAYTLTFANNGTAPAAVDRVDDLSGVLDDASFVDGSLVVDPEGALTATLDGEQIAITGSVPAGATITVSYQVTVLPDGERGDDSLGNFLLNPDEEPPAECTTDDPDCTVNPVPDLVDSKSVDPASGTAVSAGQTLTYTLTFTNTGTAPADVDRVDDLSGVLDDASFVEDSLVVDPEGDLTAERDGDQIAITGSVPAGATITVSYQVTVLPGGERGDNSVANFLLDPDQDPPAECTPGNPDCTVNPVPELVDSKSVDPASGTAVNAGQTLTYTLTFANNGTAPADVNRVDDLSGVLDDAALVEGSLVVAPEGALTATLDGTQIAITGSVPAGATITVSYQVTVLPDGERGDNSVANFLLDPDQDPPAECATDDPDCTVNPVPDLVDSKSVDPASGTAVSAGQTVTYTLTFTNSGTAATTVDRVDDLSGVLDDAEFVAGSLVVDPDGDLTAELDGDQIAITGSIPAGATITVSYQVTVLPDGERGDNSLGNFLLDPDQEPPTECTPGNPDCTVNPVPELVDSKSVDPASGSEVSAGDTLTYTLTFANNGTAPADVNRVDDLSGVLDDASFLDGSLVVNPEGALTATLDGAQIAITGSVPAGATVTVTYQVTVRADAQRGDNSLANFLLDPDQEPPTECTTDDPDCTVNPAPPIPPTPVPPTPTPTPEPTPLPATGGGDATGLALLALALMVSGAVIYASRRRMSKVGSTE